MSAESRRDLSNALTTAAAAAGTVAQAYAGALLEAEAEIKQLAAILVSANARVADLETSVTTLKRTTFDALEGERSAVEAMKQAQQVALRLAADAPPGTDFSRDAESLP